MKKYLVLLLFFATFLFGGVSAKVNTQSAVLGENIRLDITAQGEQVRFPEFDSLCDVAILESGTSQNIQNINGKTSITLTKSFIFAPQKSCTIPAFDVAVDGKIEKTQEIPIVVEKPSQTKGEPFLAEMQIDKKNLCVGEEAKLSLIFKRHYSADVVDLRFEQPQFEGLWVKKLGSEQTYRDGEYFVHKIDFLIFPQRAGEIRIANAKILVGVPSTRRDMFGFFGSRPEYKNIYSNELVINAKELPNGVNLVGEYTVAFTLDKYEADAKEPINGKLVIEGKGNIDDIPDITPVAKGASVFGEAPSREYNFEGGKHGGKYQKNIVFVGDKDFRIEGISIPYFDPAAKVVKYLKVDPVDIKIHNAESKPQKLITIAEENDSDIKEGNVAQTPKGSVGAFSLLSVGIVIGFMIGVVATKLFNAVTLRKKEKKRFALFAKKSDKELLRELLALGEKDGYIKDVILKLEDSIYNGVKSELDKKEIYKRIRRGHLA